MTAVQETYLRAWRSCDRFEGRSSVHTWLYRIAANACLTALHQRRPRVLPSGLVGPSDDPEAPPVPSEAEVAWLQPMPDELVSTESDDPADVVALREHWFSGLRTRMPFFRAQALGSSGEWRMVPTSANGQPAAAAYRRGADGVHHAFGVAVLTTTVSGIARTAVFGDPGLVPRFGLPPVAPRRPAS